MIRRPSYYEWHCICVRNTQIALIYDFKLARKEESSDLI